VFIRFVVGADGQHHRELTGIITEARLLHDRGELSTEESAGLEALYDWFNEHIAVPPFTSKGWPRDAVAWFKDDAHEPVRRMWEIAALLEDHDVQVRFLRSSSPGRVLYEDAHQVVVAEWTHL
jgi:hypothetical protein